MPFPMPEPSAVGSKGQAGHEYGINGLQVNLGRARYWLCVTEGVRFVFAGGIMDGQRPRIWRAGHENTARV